MTMFSKATVTSTAVIAGKLRLRFRGLFRKARAIQDVDVTVPTTASSPLPTDKLPASSTASSTVIITPHPSQSSEASESEYSDELSEDSASTDSASEPSTTEFPVTPRLDQSPESLFDFDSVPYEQYSDFPVKVVAFGGVARGKVNEKELVEELYGEELGSIGTSESESKSEFESESFEVDPLGVGSWFARDEEDADYGDDDSFDVSIDGELDVDTDEAEPEWGYPDVHCVRLVCGDFVRVPGGSRTHRSIEPEVVGDVSVTRH